MTSPQLPRRSLLLGGLGVIGVGALAACTSGGAGHAGDAAHATNTPHMFVVDGTGVLRYAGAIDNSPDAEGESPQGGKLVNYVEQALTELAAGRSVSVSTSKAYGCSVKY